MANLIQATVYQIDGSPLASPITVDFPVNDIIVRKDDTLNIPAVSSAIQLYSSTLNQISYKTYYVSQTVTTLVNLANDTITSFVKVNVLEINGDPVFGGIDYGFPSNQIVVNAAVNPTTGVNATIVYRNNTYSVSQTQASILSSSSGYAGVVLNQLDVPSFRSDILANIPAPGQIGRMFVSTDTYALYRDSGVSWDLIGGPGTGTVTGSGTTNYLSKWTSSSALGNSLVQDDGTNVAIGTTPATYKLNVNGTIYSNNSLVLNNGAVGNLIISSGPEGSGAGSGYAFRITNNQYGGNLTIAPTEANARAAIYSTNPIWFRKNVLMFNQTFEVTDSSVVTKFIISPSTGNTVIGGSTLAGYMLDVQGTTRISGTELRLDNGTTGTINLYSATPEIRFFAGDPTGYRLYRSGTGMIWNSGGSIGFQISGNDAYGVTAALGHVWRTANTGGAALARLDTGGSLSIGNGTNAANASSILDLTSTTKGFLPPRMTGAQAEAIGTPAAGLLVYANNGNGATITSIGWWGYNGTTWVKLN